MGLACLIFVDMAVYVIGHKCHKKNAPDKKPRAERDMGDV